MALYPTYVSYGYQPIYVHAAPVLAHQYLDVIEEEVVPDYDEVIAEWVDILDVERVRRYYPRRRYIEISDEEETETIIERVPRRRYVKSSKDSKSNRTRTYTNSQNYSTPKSTPKSIPRANLSYQESRPRTDLKSANEPRYEPSRRSSQLSNSFVKPVEYGGRTMSTYSANREPIAFTETQSIASSRSDNPFRPVSNVTPRVAREASAISNYSQQQYASSRSDNQFRPVSNVTPRVAREASATSNYSQQQYVKTPIYENTNVINNQAFSRADSIPVSLNSLLRNNNINPSTIEAVETRTPQQIQKPQPLQTEFKNNKSPQLVFYELKPKTATPKVANNTPMLNKSSSFSNRTNSSLKSTNLSNSGSNIFNSNKYFS